MSFSFFLYRRLSRFITCELRLPGNSKMSLQNKYEVASFQDVFCAPFYWQVFQFINEPPNLVIDCGAHCGHFSILADICIRSKFNITNSEYLLIEPNPHLLPIITKNLEDTNLSVRCKLIPGLLGSNNGHNTLWVHPKNYLTASLQPIKGAKPHKICSVDLKDFVGDRTVDLMKIDIEGAEYDFVKENNDFLSKVNLLFLELHHDLPNKQNELFDALKLAGLHLVSKLQESTGNQFLVFQR